jgi:hypothetical protein
MSTPGPRVAATKRFRHKIAKKAAKKQPGVNLKLRQSKINSGLRHPYYLLHSQYTGFHTKVVLEVAKQRVTSRASQFLTHLATALKAWMVTLNGNSEIEVQIALFNGDYLIISSNKNVTATDAYEALVRNEAGSFLQSLKLTAHLVIKRAAKSLAADSYRISRHAKKLIKELDGQREVGIPALGELEAEGQDVCVTLDVCSDDIGTQFANFCNGRMDGKRVAILTSTGMEMHAEQKILLALCRAANDIPREVPVVFAGTFRPCRGCFESLSVVQTFCFPELKFGHRPGHLWQTTARAHVEIAATLLANGYLRQEQHRALFDENGLLKGLTTTSYRPMIRDQEGVEHSALHYATDSDSSSDEDEDGEGYEGDEDAEDDA